MTPSDRHGALAEPSFSFSLGNDLDQLNELLAQLEEFGEANEVSPLQTQRIVLSVDELVTNVIKYGQREKEGRIDVRADIEDSVFHLEIEDHGIPFNPFSEAPVPDTNLPLEDRPIGGLGVFLVESLMSSTRYERIEDRNRITLTRSLSAGDQEDNE